MIQDLEYTISHIAEGRAQGGRGAVPRARCPARDDQLPRGVHLQKRQIKTPLPQWVVVGDSTICNHTIHIYIYIERERERFICIYVYIQGDDRLPQWGPWAPSVEKKTIKIDKHEQPTIT